MNEKLFELTQRRGELLAKIAAQRVHLTDEIEAEWKVPLALADQGLVVVRYLRNHPLLITGIMVFYMMRRRSVAGMAWGVWRAWKTYRELTSPSGKLSPRV